MAKKGGFTEPRQASFPVVALCGSAGGLEAFQAFFGVMPDISGMAFVVVQHLASSHESVLDILIQRHTQIRVERISDNSVLQPDHIYVLPAGYFLDLWNGSLQLTPYGPEYVGLVRTIDQFLISLARDQGTRAAALIFSGAGTDSLEGARSIKHYGGFVLAQDLDSASHVSMPANVIKAGLADSTSNPAHMPNILIDYFQRTLADYAPPPLQTIDISEADMRRVIRRLQRLIGHDFTAYKRSAFERQLRLQIAESKHQSIDAYLDHLTRSREEAEQLAKNLLINVTSFFRDSAAFEALKEKALLPALRKANFDTPFRVWVPGCASGEEAVSIAILIHECLQELQLLDLEVRIFATDVSHDIIQRARWGIFPASIKAHISPTRLRAHFIEEDNGYRLRNHISRMITWGVHNLTEHPPFSRLNLISCRNVLIYYQQNMQERLIALFTFALYPDGMLLLGRSESLPYTTQAFTTIDHENRIYQRLEAKKGDWLSLDQPLFVNVPQHDEQPTSDHLQVRRPSETQELEIIKNMLVAHYDSTCAIVDDQYQVRYTFGDIDHFLKIPPGKEDQHNILSMAREGLDTALIMALHMTTNGGQVITREGIRVKHNGGERTINLIIKPIAADKLPDGHKLIVFEQVSAKLHDDEVDPAEAAADSMLKHLQDELEQSQHALHSVTQALQAKDEELTTSLEEARSANEEVQSTNEALRNSKAETESMNEELNILNNQLADQNSALSRANSTLYNFLQSTPSGMIFVDEDLTIKDFTVAVTDIFGLREADKGRPLREIAHQLIYSELMVDAERVLNASDTIEKEVRTRSGKWYHVYIHSYRTISGIVDGLALIFSDISRQKAAESDARAYALYLSAIFDTLEHSLIELDSNLRVLTANRSFYKTFQVSMEDTLGKEFHNMGNGQWNTPELHRLLTDIIPEQNSVHEYTVTRNFPKLGDRTIHVNARHFAQLDRILLVFTDVSQAAPAVQ